jgi:hypothetical protein
MRNVEWGLIVNVSKYCMKQSLLTITYMATVLNFEVISGKLNTVGLCSTRNLAQKSLNSIIINLLVLASLP